MRTLIAVGSSVALIAGTLAIAAPALAAPNYTLFGDASTVSSGGNPGAYVQASSNSTAPGYGGIDFALPSGTTVNNLNTLATDYMIIAGDCGGGSPRFAISTAIGNIFVYLGPTPSFTGCASGWQSSGNVLSDADLRVDTSQLPGGTFYDTWAHAKALAGSQVITDLALVVDAGWAFPTSGQSVGFDNTNINGTVNDFTPPPPVATNKDQCKNGGWMSYVDGGGNHFKNQGDCVSFVSTKGKNTGAGGQ